MPLKWFEITYVLLPIVLEKMAKDICFVLHWCPTLPTSQTSPLIKLTFPTNDSVVGMLYDAFSQKFSNSGLPISFADFWRRVVRGFIIHCTAAPFLSAVWIHLDSRVVLLIQTTFCCKTKFEGFISAFFLISFYSHESNVIMFPYMIMRFGKVIHLHWVC